jgi:hypothetical protein
MQEVFRKNITARRLDLYIPPTSHTDNIKIVNMRSYEHEPQVRQVP